LFSFTNYNEQLSKIIDNNNIKKKKKKSDTAVRSQGVPTPNAWKFIIK
jgi:hypothetical protein